MNLTPEQDKAANGFANWLDSGQGDIFKISGYAGTGKTFLLSQIIAGLSCQFWCCAPTGKAASVLSSKLGGLPVLTVHQLLYQPVQKSIAELTKMIEENKVTPNATLAKKIEEEKLKLAGERPGFSLKEDSLMKAGDLVILDEGSMATPKMIKDFIAAGVRLLIVGDEGQLPPVGNSSWFNSFPSDFELVEVQRQALDNPIIRLSMEIRNGVVDSSQYCDGVCRILPKSKAPRESWLEHDQVITGMNATRQKINRFFRKQLGYDSRLPVRYEKLICLKNDIKGDVPVVNGAIFHCLADVTHGERIHDCELIDFSYNGREVREKEFYTYHCLRHYDYSLVEEPREFRFGLMELDFAYAITVHKSQGSEWNKVLLADDGFQENDKEFRKRWLYTAVTRAKEELVIVK